VLQNALEAMHARKVTQAQIDDLNAAIVATPDRVLRPDALYITPDNRSKEQVLKAIYDADAANAPGGGPGTEWKERGLLLTKMSLVHRKGKAGHTDLRLPPMREALAKVVRAAHRKELKGLPRSASSSPERIASDQA
jgi:hypothetical protein